MTGLGERRSYGVSEILRFEGAVFGIPASAGMMPWSSRGQEHPFRAAHLFADSCVVETRGSPVASAFLRLALDDDLRVPHGILLVARDMTGGCAILA